MMMKKTKICSSMRQLCLSNVKVLSKNLTLIWKMILKQRGKFRSQRRKADLLEMMRSLS